MINPGPDDEVIRRIQIIFPAPLNCLMVEQYVKNLEILNRRDESETTFCADRIRKLGLTRNQERWAIAITEQMDGPHPAYEKLDNPLLDSDEIAMDTLAADLIDEVR